MASPLSTRSHRSHLMLSVASLAMGLAGYGRSAYAQSCAPTTANSYICSGTITAPQTISPTGDADISIAGDTTFILPNNSGSFALFTGSYGAASVTIDDVDARDTDGNSSASISNPTGWGVFARSGDVSIDLAADVTAQAYGVWARGQTGDVDVKLSGTVISQNLDAVHASSYQGNVTVTTSGEIVAGRYGIWADSFGGDLTIVSDGEIDAGRVGIRAHARTFGKYGQPKDIDLDVTVTRSVTGGKYGAIDLRGFQDTNNSERAYVRLGIVTDEDAERITISSDSDTVIRLRSEKAVVSNFGTNVPTGEVGGQATLFLNGAITVDGDIEVVSGQSGILVGTDTVVTGGITDISTTTQGNENQTSGDTFIFLNGKVGGPITLGEGQDVVFLNTSSTYGAIDGGTNQNDQPENDLLAIGAGGFFSPDTQTGTFDISRVDFGLDGGQGQDLTGFETVAAKYGTITLKGSNADTGTLYLGAEAGIIVTGDLGGIAVNTSKYDVNSTSISTDRSLIGGSGRLGDVAGPGLSIAPGETVLDGQGTFGKLALASLDISGTRSAGVGDEGDYTTDDFFAEIADEGAGTLRVDIGADGQSDLVDVAGMAKIDGARLLVNGVGAGFRNAQQFTVLQANEGIAGAFAEVRDNIADVRVVAFYEGNVSGDEMSEGQGSVVLGLEVDETEQTDKSISSASLGAAMQLSRTFSDVLLQQARQDDDSTPSTTASSRGGVASSQGSIGSMRGMLTGGGLRVFGNVVANSENVDRDGTATGYDTEMHGFQLGVETSVAMGEGKLSYGVAAGYVDGSVDADNSDADIDSRHVGVFARYESGPLQILGALNYGDLDIHTRRDLGAAGIGSGRTDGNSITGSFEVSYDIAQRIGLENGSLSPYFGVQASHANYDGFDETGAGTTLEVKGGDISTQFLRVGVRSESMFMIGSTVLRPSVSVGVEHAVGDLSAVTVSNLGVGADIFTSAAEIDRNRLTTGLGLDIGDGRVRGHIRYDGAFGSDSDGHQASVGLSIRF